MELYIIENLEKVEEERSKKDRAIETK